MAIILVPTDAADILTAIGLANPNDDIVLEQVGTPFQGANNRNNDPGGLDPLTIEGETGDPIDVVVDCQNVDPARGFLINNGETATCILQNITVENGNITGGQGGGIFCQSSHPTITNCIIKNNTSSHGGGGIRFYLSNSTLNNCVITGNSGGVLGGGGIEANTSNITLNNCILTGNSAKYGGGLHLAYSTQTLNNCTIADNSGSLLGGGLSCTENNVVITDSIIWGNTSGTIPSHQLYIYASTIVTLNYCDYSNGAGDIHNDGTLNITNSITTDPLFIVGPQGNYYLSQIAAGQGADSPAVDAGSDTAANLGFDTKTTRTDETTDSGQVDMGWHYLLLLPDQSSNPNPGDGETEVSVDQELGWDAAAGADSYDIYFGTDEAAVTAAGHGDPEFKGNQPGITYDPAIDCGITYYWRIDTVNAGGTVTGEVWSLTTLACSARLAYARMRWGSVG